MARSGVAARYEQILAPEVLEAIRRALRRMNPGILLIWRLGLGWSADLWPGGFGRLMVIEHVGRRSGARYRTPVNFTRDGDHVYCVVGFGPHTDWYRNVLARPEIAVWLPDGRWSAHAEDASGDPRRLHLMRKVLVDSGCAAPAIGLHPRRLADEELDKATASYRLLRITPLRREHAPDGPGDLAWVWWPLGAALVVGCLVRWAGCGRVAARTARRG